jgi:hypothetical protein
MHKNKTLDTISHILVTCLPSSGAHNNVLRCTVTTFLRRYYELFTPSVGDAGMLETLYPTLISSPTPPLFPDSPVVDDASEEDKSPHNKSILTWRHTIYTTLWAFVLLEAKT